MLPIEALHCTEQGGIALAPLVQAEIANAVRVGRAALAATAPAAPGGLRIPDLPPIAAERIAAVLDGLTPPEDDEDN